MSLFLHLDKFSFKSLVHQLILQWMGAVRMRVQTADKNIQIMNKWSTWLQSISWWLVKQKAVYQTNPPRHFKTIASDWNTSPLPINLLSAGKSSFCLNQERNMYRSSTAYKQKQSKTVLNLYVCEFRCERTTGGGLFHWKKHYYCLSIGVLARINGLNLKNLNDWFVSNKHAAFHITRL